MSRIFACIATAGILSLSGFSSCDQKKDGKITADIVTNSQTAGGVDENIPRADIRFAEDTFNFGEALEGEKVVHAFRFRNVGKNNLVISNAVGSCGCTVPEWPKEPIKPGAEGVINVVFDTKGRAGIASKSVTVFSNTEPAARKVYLKGFVKAVSKD